MATQTTYPSTQPIATAGLQATMKPATFVSRTVETEAGIGFGRAVAQGTADKGVIAFAGGVVLGITALDRSATGINKDTGARVIDTFGEGESARIQTKGDIWVVCTTGCSAGDGVFVRPSNGDFQDSSADSAVQIVGARWDTSAAALGLAVVNLG